MIEIQPITSSAWVDFVSNRPDSMIFHHPSWNNLLADCYGYRSFVLVSLDEEGHVNGGIPFMPSGILANDNGVVIGSLTTGPEVLIISSILGQ